MRATLAAVSVTIRRLPWTTRLPALDEWPQRRRDPVRRRVLERDDLRDHLVVTPGGVRLGADDGGKRPLARRGRRQDLVEIPRAHGRHAVDLEHREEDVEDLVLRDASRGLDRDLLPRDPGPDRVVEPRDLARRLDDGLDVGIVEVENDLPAGPGRGDRTTGRRLGRLTPSGSRQAGGSAERRGRGGSRRRRALAGRFGPRRRAGLADRRLSGRRCCRRLWRGRRLLRARPGLRPGGSRAGAPAKDGDEAYDRDPAKRDRLDHSSSVGDSCPSELGGGAGTGVGTLGRPGDRIPPMGGAGPGGLGGVGRTTPPASGRLYAGRRRGLTGFCGVVEEHLEGLAAAAQHDPIGLDLLETRVADEIPHGVREHLAPLYVLEIRAAAALGENHDAVEARLGRGRRGRSRARRCRAGAPGRFRSASG